MGKVGYKAECVYENPKGAGKTSMWGGIKRRDAIWTDPKCKNIPPGTMITVRAAIYNATTGYLNIYLFARDAETYDTIIPVNEWKDVPPGSIEREVIIEIPMPDRNLKIQFSGGWFT